MDTEIKKQLDELCADGSGKLWAFMMLGMIASGAFREESHGTE